MSGSGNDAVEEVLAVPRATLDAAGLLETGFRAGGHLTALPIVEAEGVFLPRPRAEDDPSWKQIIPYAVVRCRELVFMLRRTARGAESRLHELLSIGVGGHVNPAPVDARQRVEDGLRRELEEELAWGAPYRCPAYRYHALGTINDDANDVGRVHFGIVYLVETESTDVYVRETDLLEGGFVTPAEIREQRHALESWSRQVFDAVLNRSAE